ncbi:conserved hypothetical protein [Talaromyces stipitatus ATCC 10500]|uniref:Uncharacterized protein n=1 Tax=Talaromyces stipitatus (strain ATCC 10500 / CBS 375.48 / QM 6759 / NRRL 1006) TaxID=441959 RepID=B8M631_TALSN|nr:uncharacterized protein TSTA_023660 [Talaromyces stipitatus ATCC 10500]EED19031.1 conserved hypothetical protein [Talaromyces stipitatus ATCC 10500]
MLYDRLLVHQCKKLSSLIEKPFDIHVLLSTLSFEAPKYHITHFLRFMWSQNADSRIANADVAIISAKGIQEAHAKLHKALGSFLRSRERAADTIEKDGMMSLVFNLVTLQDAANSIEIAADTKRNNTSMNAIAAMTMVFLPGTFTATILDAGIFFTNNNGHGIRVSSLWWLWVALPRR